MILRKGDIFVTRGDSVFGFGIRWFTRTDGEADTEVNHVGIVVGDGTQWTALVVEALHTVKLHRLADQYQGKWTGVRVYRPLFLERNVLDLLAKNATSRVGQRYGYTKIAAHAIDRWLFGGRYVVRKLFFLDQVPICSYLVADVYGEVCGYRFGVDVREAQPDDLDDWCKARPEEWEEVTPLLPIEDWDEWARAKK